MTHRQNRHTPEFHALDRYVSRNEKLAASYFASASRCRERLAELRQLIGDNPTQQERLVRIKAQLAEALGWRRQSIETGRKNRAAAINIINE